MNEGMSVYSGCKFLAAKPMLLGAYNEYRGWQLPGNENPETAGYLVEYSNGGEPNHPDHAGYIRWSPKELFERTYTLAGKMNFSEALNAIKSGLKVARVGWNGKGMFVFMVEGSQFKVNRAPLMGIFPEGTTINYRPHLDMRAADGTIGVWLASQSDIFADDWVVVV